jgi:hypothetical protein
MHLLDAREESRHMAKPIITALRARSDLKESVLHTSTELAHRSSIYGVVRASYTYMAEKCHCCRQTIINHVKICEEKGILRKRVVQVKGSPFCEVNVYTFILPWRKTPAQTCNSQNSGPKFPPEETCHDKFGSLRGEIAGLQKGRRFLTPGSEVDEAVCAKIAILKALLGEGASDGPLYGLQSV